MWKYCRFLGSEWFDIDNIFLYCCSRNEQVIFGNINFQNLKTYLIYASSDQGCKARKVNCSCVYSAYILKPVLSGRNLQTRIDISVQLVSEEVKSI